MPEHGSHYDEEDEDESTETREIRASDFRELEGKTRYELGRGLYLIPTRAILGNARPVDTSDEGGDAELTFENTEIVEVDIRFDEGELVAEIPDRDALYEMWQEARDEGDGSA